MRWWKRRGGDPCGGGEGWGGCPTRPPVGVARYGCLRGGMPGRTVLVETILPLASLLVTVTLQSPLTVVVMVPPSLCGVTLVSFTLSQSPLAIAGALTVMASSMPQAAARRVGRIAYASFFMDRISSNWGTAMAPLAKSPPGNPVGRRVDDTRQTTLQRHDWSADQI